MPRRVGQKFLSEFERIFASSLGQLIDKTFDNVAVLRIPDGAPKAHRYAGFSQNVFTEKIRNAVLHLNDAFDRTIIKTILHGARKKPRHNRRADDTAFPSDWPAVRIQARSDFRIGRWPVEVMLHVVFARPGHLDGCAGP